MIFCFAAVLLAISVPASAQSLAAVFGRMDAAAPRFKAIEANIKRDVHTAIVNDDTLQTGTIRVKREKPGDIRMLIDFVAPDPQTISFDGSTVSIYYPKIKTIQVYDVGNKKSLINRFLLLGFGVTSAAIQADYDVSWAGAETIDGRATNHIQLVPKSKDVLQYLKKAGLWISDSDGLPAQQRFVTSNSGDFMLVTYSNMKVNPALSDGSLKLNTPKGVKTEHPQF